MPATTRALYSPLILSNIFEKISDFEDDRFEVYCNCISVSCLWFTEAAPYLWRHAEDMEYSFGRDLNSRLRAIDPSRRQFYANSVEFAMDHANATDNPDTENIIRDLVFPKLRRVHLNLLNGSPHIPRYKGNIVEGITLDPECTSAPGFFPYLVQGKIEKLLDNIAEFFPKAKTIEFLDETWAYPGSLARFKARMPFLENFYRVLVEGSRERGFSVNRSLAEDQKSKHASTAALSQYWKDCHQPFSTKSPLGDSRNGPRDPDLATQPQFATSPLAYASHRAT